MHRPRQQGAAGHRNRCAQGQDAQGPGKRHGMWPLVELGVKCLERLKAPMARKDRPEREISIENNDAATVVRLFGQEFEI